MSGTTSRVQAVKDTLKAATVLHAQPAFEANLVETIGIRKFLVYAMDDIRGYVGAYVQERCARARVRRNQGRRHGHNVVDRWQSGNHRWHVATETKGWRR